MSDDPPPVGAGLALPDVGRADGSGRASPAPTGGNPFVTRIGRQTRLTTLSVRLIQLLLTVAFLLAWEAAVATGRADRFFFSQPSAIGRQLWDWFSSGSIYPHIAITLVETVLGFLVGSAVGLVLGFVLARSENLGDVLEPAMAILNAMPRVVLAPIFILWLGLGLESKVGLSASVVVTIVFYAAFTGVREVDRNLIDNARILGANNRHLTTHVLIPSALTWIFASLRVSVGFALAGAVVAEYLGANRGVGYLIAFSEAMFQSTGVFAGLIVLGLMVLVINLALTRIERRYSAWKPERA